MANKNTTIVKKEKMLASDIELLISKNHLRDENENALQNLWFTSNNELELLKFYKSNEEFYYGLICSCCSQAYEKNPFIYQKLANNPCATAGYRVFKSGHIKSHMGSAEHSAIWDNKNAKSHMKKGSKEKDNNQLNLYQAYGANFAKEWSSDSVDNIEQFYILLNNLHFIIKNINSLAQFPKLNEFLQFKYEMLEEKLKNLANLEEFDLKNYNKYFDMLKNILKYPSHYTNANSGKEIMACYAEIIEQRIINMAKSSNRFIGLAVDEALDVTTNEHLIMIIRFIDNLGLPSEKFLHLEELKNWDAISITKTIKD